MYAQHDSIDSRRITSRILHFQKYADIDFVCAAITVALMRGETINPFSIVGTGCKIFASP